MYGIVNKILGVLMVLILMILMLCNIMVAHQLQARRSVVAEVTNFVDELTDTGTLTEKHITDLNLAVNAYGPVCDVKIERYARIINPDPKAPGQTYTTYAYDEDISTLNQGDLCKVTVTEAGHTGIAYFLYRVLSIVMQPIDFSFTGRIR